MSKPVIEIITERALLVAGQEQTVDVLIRIAPPAPEIKMKRPGLNLSLVLDRSGSMEGEKMSRAREAARFCIDQLLAEDRVGLVIFDDVVEVLVPNQRAENKAAIKEIISGVRARNSTALHEAWVRGGIEVGEHMMSDGINRVLLITDGLANVGETNVDRIVTQAGELAARGVSTSTIGIGSDFNEDLLIPMAEAGRGNAWHVEHPSEMERIFATEMKGLIAQVGHTVSLGLSPVERVKVADVLNDFEMTHTGRYKLPNFLAGSPVDVVVRLKIPAKAAGEKFKALDLRLAWNPQGAPSSEREVVSEGVTLEFTAARDVEEIPADERVVKAVQLLMAARARREAIADLDRGDVTAARAKIIGTAQMMAQACAPFMADAEIADEMKVFDNLKANLTPQADLKMTRKKMTYQSYKLSRRGKKS